MGLIVEVEMGFTARYTARYKVMPAMWVTDRVASGVPYNTKAYKSVFQEMAAYSCYCYLDRLNKADAAKYEQLRDGPYDTYIPDVGFKTLYKKRRASDPDEDVFIIAHIEDAKLKARREGRETIALKRFSVADFGDYDWYDYRRPPNGHTRDRLTREEACLKYMKGNKWSVRSVFKDRLKKSELEKFALLLLLPEDSYVEGFGGVVKGNTRNAPDERLYFLEV
jgi:hypothetical protein